MLAMQEQLRQTFEQEQREIAENGPSDTIQTTTADQPKQKKQKISKVKNDASDFQQDANSKRVLKFKRDIYKIFTTGKKNFMIVNLSIYRILHDEKLAGGNDKTMCS